MTYSSKRQCYICLVFLLTSTLSCSFLRDQEKLDKAKEAVELKKKHYASLQDNVRSNSLQKGMTPPAIKELFGEPDDIFQSGSIISSFQIWTYEKVMEQKDEKDWNPIRLYFNNNKLINWRY